MERCLIHRNDFQAERNAKPEFQSCGGIRVYGQRVFPHRQVCQPLKQAYSLAESVYCKQEAQHAAFLVSSVPGLNLQIAQSAQLHRAVLQIVLC